MAFFGVTLSVRHKLIQGLLLFCIRPLLDCLQKFPAEEIVEERTWWGVGALPILTAAGGPR